jgi:uncharacterized protein YjbJ (UPF0337 family)
MSLGMLSAWEEMIRFIGGATTASIADARVYDTRGRIITDRRNNMGEISDKSKGRIKQAVGDLTGNAKLKREGERDELRGEIKGAVKDVKRAIKKAVK